MILNKDAMTPLYEQIIDFLLEKISTGQYQPGDQIPTEAELCDYFNVSRITVRRSINELVEQGKLVKKRGKGTFVAYPKVVETITNDGSFMHSAILSGKKPSTIIHSSQVLKRKAFNREYLCAEFENEEAVILVERVRLIDGQPMIFECDYFFENFEFIQTVDLENQPIMNEITQKTGLVAKTFEDSISVVLATEKISQLLECEVDMPLLKVEQKVLTASEELIYFNVQFIRSDLYKYVVRSER